MKKIQKDLQRRSFKLYYHVNNSFLPKFTPTANFDLYLNFENADFGLHRVYHVTYTVDRKMITLKGVQIRNIFLYF